MKTQDDFNNENEYRAYLEGVRDGQKKYWENFESTKDLLFHATYELKKVIDDKKSLRLSGEIGDL